MSSTKLYRPIHRPDQNRYRDLHCFSKEEVETWNRSFAGEPSISGDIESQRVKIPPGDLLSLIRHYRNSQISRAELLDEGDEKTDDEQEEENDSAGMEESSPDSGTEAENGPLEQALNSGKFDDWLIAPTFLPARYHNVVYKILKRFHQPPLIGTIRRFKFTPDLCDRGLAPPRQRLIQELQEELPSIVKLMHPIPAPNFQEGCFDADELDIVISDDLLPSRLVPVGKGILRNRLLKILQNEFGTLSIRNVAGITLERFLSIKSVRKHRAKELLRLQRELPDLVKLEKALRIARKAEFQDLVVRLVRLDPIELTTASKIMDWEGSVQLSIGNLFHPWEEELGPRRKRIRKGLGKLDVWRLRQMRQKIALALQRGDEGWFACGEVEAAGDLQRVEQALLIHLASWLEAKPFKMGNNLLEKVFLIRHGLGGKSETLDRLSEKIYNDGECSRERVRQIQKKADCHFIGSLPFTQEALADVLRGQTVWQLAEGMPTLFELFQGDLTRFRKFLSFLTDDASLFHSR